MVEVVVLIGREEQHRAVERATFFFDRADDHALGTIDQRNPELDGIGRYQFGWSDRDDAGAGAKRGLVIAVVAPGTISVRLKIELPATFSARAPLPFEMKRDYAEYRAAYDLKGATFTAERFINLRAREIPAARLRDYAAFRRRAGFSAVACFRLCSSASIKLMTCAGSVGAGLTNS